MTLCKTVLQHLNTKIIRKESEYDKYQCSGDERHWDV